MSSDGAPRADPPGPPSRKDEELRMAEYAEVVGMVKLLTEVRFKLAALIPALTGGAVAAAITTARPIMRPRRRDTNQP